MSALWRISGGEMAAACLGQCPTLISKHHTEHCWTTIFMQKFVSL